MALLRLIAHDLHNVRRDVAGIRERMARLEGLFERVYARRLRTARSGIVRRTCGGCEPGPARPCRGRTGSSAHSFARTLQARQLGQRNVAMDHMICIGCLTRRWWESIAVGPQFSGAPLGEEASLNVGVQGGH